MKAIFLYANGCEDCERMRGILEEHNIEFIAIESEEENAVDLAIENDISDLPGCNINGKVFQGERFNEKKMRSFLENMIDK